MSGEQSPQILDITNDHLWPTQVDNLTYTEEGR